MHLFKSMNDWILSLAIVILIIAIISLILPEGKMGKTVKGFFSLIIILIMIKPILNFNGDKLLNYQVNVNSNESQDQYLNYVFRQKATNYQNLCNKIAINNGINAMQTRIEYSVNDKYEFEIKNVKIEISPEQELNNEQLNLALKKTISEIATNLMIKENIIEAYVVR